MIPIERLYIATIAEDAEALARDFSVGLELDEFCTAANMDGDAFATWDADVRRKLALAGRHILHAPFAELYPAAVDPLARALAMQRLTQAADLAAAYGIDRMVAHAGFVPEVYHPDWFVPQSAAFWREFLQSRPAGYTLYIENVLEDDPHMLARMLTEIGDPRAQLCLDIGHAHARSQYALSTWVDVLAPHIGHVHLHSNDGSADTHSDLSRGTLPVWDTIALLLRRAPMATYTLEMQQARPSLEALLARQSGADGDAPRDLLRQIFGYDDFREGQRALIDAQLAGQDALGIMPTGSGKSVCFQIPALLREGTALVISPLISLMKDQVAALNQNGVRAAYLNSSLTERQMSAALRNAEAGEYRLIYVAPERLLTERFLRFATQASVSLVAVDEAHCISQWGQDFRPNYLDIPAFLAALPGRPPLSAFTATATPQVREDIVRLLGMRSPAIVQTGFDRPSLHFAVERPKKKDIALLSLLEGRHGESGIIYCATRKNVEAVCALLQANGYAATRYHAGLSDAERRENQEAFSFDRCPVMVATNAFGMGIDKSNVRYVIHYNMPKDLESYYQEAGRAGRDGEPADCILLYSGQDVTTQKYLIDLEDESTDADPRLRAQMREKSHKRLAEMVQYCRTPECLRQTILRYFGEATAGPCGHCGNCEAQTEAKDVTAIALPVLRAVAVREARFGLGIFLQMLRGKSTKRVRQLRMDSDDQFGALADVSESLLKDIGEQLLAEDYLRASQGTYPVVSLGAKGRRALDEGKPIHLRLAAPYAGKPTAPVAAAFGKATEMESLADRGLFEALRVLRMRLANQLGVPAFVIFSDTTLRDMSARKPQTRADLLQVKGVGEAKLKQYGDTFLREIDAYQRRATSE